MAWVFIRSTTRVWIVWLLVTGFEFYLTWRRRSHRLGMRDLPGFFVLNPDADVRLTAECSLRVLFTYSLRAYGITSIYRRLGHRCRHRWHPILGTSFPPLR